MRSYWAINNVSASPAKKEAKGRRQDGLAHLGWPSSLLPLSEAAPHQAGRKYEDNCTILSNSATEGKTGSEQLPSVQGLGEPLSRASPPGTG